ncbi:nuclear protein [Physocladia obscura]|uniref:Non-structural maintenance of chromosomes element 4 n=1 Tax=Physocladia obscura TaxID=109957 RepID=A0AAD5T9H5_9FUNG|nr:nuclear protein [Physocladia obscura]
MPRRSSVSNIPKRIHNNNDTSEDESSDDEFANATQRAAAKKRKLDNRNKNKANSSQQSNNSNDANNSSGDGDSNDDNNDDNDGDDDDDDNDDIDDLPPAQSKDEKRAIRRSYRELQQHIEDNQSEMIKPNSTGILESLKRANENFENVQTSQEAALDSKVLTTAAKLTVKKVMNMKLAGRSLNIGDFMKRVRARLLPADARGGGLNDDDENMHELDWIRLRKEVAVCGFSAPALEFMYGPLSVEQKTRNQSRKFGNRLQKDLTQLQKPQELVETDIQKQENETTKCVANVFKVLMRKGAMNFFEFVINPESFSQSVENIFYVSFLIRDGLVSMDIEDGQPILKRSKTEKCWEEIIDAYDIQDTVIPTRARTQEPAAARNADKWYG